MDLRYLGVFDRVYAYARVSSIEQAEVRKSIINQRNRLLSVIPQPNRIYEDHLTATNSNRPEYLELLEQVKEDALIGLVVLVVITEKSRLTREGGDKLVELIEYFEKYNVVLYSLDGGVLTVNKSSDWLSNAMEGTFNKFFIKQLQDRLKASNERARLEKRPLAKKPPYGFTYTREKLVINLEQYIIARRIIETYISSKISLHDTCKIALSLGWKISVEGLRHWFNNPILRGHIWYRDVKTSKIKVYYNTHDGILSEQEYQTILIKFRQNKAYARVGAKKTRKPLSGILRCKFCQSNLRVTSTHLEKYYYKHGNIKCDGFKAVRVDRIEKPLIKKLSERSIEISEMIVKPEISVSPEILELQESLRELYSFYNKNPSNHLLAAIRETEEKIAELSDSVESLKPISEDLIKSLSNIDFWEGLSENDRKLIYAELVEAIYVKNSNDFEIVLKF